MMSTMAATTGPSWPRRVRKGARARQGLADQQDLRARQERPDRPGRRDQRAPLDRPDQLVQPARRDRQAPKDPRGRRERKE
jgi:hypothetical protein